MIKQIRIKRGKYHIVDEAGNEMIRVSKEIGEVVGYNGNRFLCRADGKYKVYTLQGEVIDTFQMYQNPYPLRISVPLGQSGLKFRITVEDEEEEVCWRKRIRILRSLKQHTIEGMVGELFQLLEDWKCSCPEIELFDEMEKNLSRFLQEYLCQDKSLCTDDEKLGRLVLSLAQCLPSDLQTSCFQ